MRFILKIVSGPLGLWRRWQLARSRKEYAIYDCVVAQEAPGWLVIEVQWKDLRHFLEWRPKFNSLPNDTINAKLDFSQVTVSPDMIRHNPAIRIRKGSKSEVVPAIVAGPVDSGVYFLLVGKLILTHVERQFSFNFVTWPVANALPLLAGAGLFTIWGFIDGWHLHQSNDFFSAIALVVTVTGLAFAIWRLIVQESDKRHDARCRRLEHELMAHQTNQLTTSIGEVQKLLERHLESGLRSEQATRSQSGTSAGPSGTHSE